MTLDELLIAQEAMQDIFKRDVKIKAALAGVEDADSIFPEDQQELEPYDTEDFKELLEFERKNYKPKDEFADFALGHQQIDKQQFEQLFGNASRN